MIVHGARPSPYARKVLIVLEEKGLAYEQKNLAPFPKTPELLAMHPQGKIPILEHDGRFLPDSSVICAYLERLYPEPAMFPADPKEFAQVLFVEEFSDTTLSSAVGAVFFERFVKPNFFQQETDEARVAEAIENELPPAFDYLEGQLGEGAETVLGTFSIADAALAGQLGNLALVDVEIDAARWPKLAAYVKVLTSRPSYRKALEG